MKKENFNFGICFRSSSVNLGMYRYTTCGFFIHGKWRMSVGFYEQKLWFFFWSVEFSEDRICFVFVILEKVKSESSISVNELNTAFDTLCMRLLLNVFGLYLLEFVFIDLSRFDLDELGDIDGVIRRKVTNNSKP